MNIFRNKETDHHLEQVL